MPKPPYAVVVDPRDVRAEADADQVRVEVWEGVSFGRGGTCTTYAAPVERLMELLAWQKGNPALRVNIALTTRLSGEVVLVTLLRADGSGE